MLPTSAATASGRTSLNKDSRKVGHRERTHPREYVMSFSFWPRSSNTLSIGNPCRSSSTSRISTFRPMHRLIEMHHESFGSPKPANRHAGNTNTEWCMRPIPAHAGETAPGVSSRDLPPAYPRTRGGNAWRSYAGTHARGLSPHTRGKRNDTVRLPLRDGPIPAHAGETLTPYLPNTSQVWPI